MNRQRCCHYCGQELPEHRLGVRLGPKEGRIFDYIAASATDGISNDDLCDLTGITPGSLKGHVYNINEKLMATDYQIIGRRNVRWLINLPQVHRDSDALTPEQQKAFGL